MGQPPFCNTPDTDIEINLLKTNPFLRLRLYYALFKNTLCCNSCVSFESVLIVPNDRARMSPPHDLLETARETRRQQNDNVQHKRRVTARQKSYRHNRRCVHVSRKRFVKPLMIPTRIIINSLAFPVTYIFNICI